MVKSVESVGIFPAAFVRVSSMLTFIAITLLVDAFRQILASVNSPLTYLWIESGGPGLFGFQYVIISFLCSVQLLLLLKYSLRQATTQK